jgi:hypothetical protein
VLAPALVAGVLGTRNRTGIGSGRKARNDIVSARFRRRISKILCAFAVERHRTNSSAITCHRGNDRVGGQFNTKTQ